MRMSWPEKVDDIGTGDVVISTFTLGLRARTTSMVASKSARHCS